MATDQRWIFGHALHVENRQVGTFSRSTLYSKLTLVETQSNWLLASIPTPNVTEGWKISAVMLRYTIRGRAGLIDKVGLRDGEQVVHSFEGLNVGPAAGWQTLNLPLSPAMPFKFGLGVSIHANYPDNFDPQPLGPAEFLFVSVGLGFVRQSAEWDADARGRVKYWEIFDRNLKKSGWSLGYVSAIDSNGRTNWIADAHRDGKRYVVRAGEKLTAFVELESVVQACGEFT